MSEAWSSIDYALEIIGQLSKASGVRLYLARKWASVRFTQSRFLLDFHA
jgi:hypothetical protein